MTARPLIYGRPFGIPADSSGATRWQMVLGKLSRLAGRTCGCRFPRRVAQNLVRRLGEDLKSALQRRARAHGRSTEEEVREILRDAVRLGDNPTWTRVPRSPTGSAAWGWHRRSLK